MLRHNKGNNQEKKRPTEMGKKFNLYIGLVINVKLYDKIK